jgi:4a-hydroxytetrahydrobiopterin dehydratase
MTRASVQAVVAGLGWRHVLGTLRATVAVTSLPEAAAAAAICAPLDDAGLLSLDLRPGRVLLTLDPAAEPAVTLAGRLTAALAAAGLATVPEACISTWQGRD